MLTLTPSQTTRTRESFEDTGEVGWDIFAAFVQVIPGMSLGTVGRTILAFAPCVIAAAFGGVALTAWETTMSLLAVEWSDQIETPMTGEWESDVSGNDRGGHGCGRIGHDELSERTKTP